MRTRQCGLPPMCYKGGTSYIPSCDGVAAGGLILWVVGLALSGDVCSSVLSLVCHVLIVFVERARAFYECI